MLYWVLVYYEFTNYDYTIAGVREKRIPIAM